MSKKNRIPKWVVEYLATIENLKKLSSDRQIYSGDQPKLSVLKETGKGNCVAMSKLFAEILKKYKVDGAQQIIIGIMDPDEDRHQITLVYEGTERVWYQSNEVIICFKTLSQLNKFMEKEMGWKNKPVAIFSQRWLYW